MADSERFGSVQHGEVLSASVSATQAPVSMSMPCICEDQCQSLRPEACLPGFTRIPVYQEHRDNIVGILYAKDLILVDPDDGVEINAVLSFRYFTLYALRLLSTSL